MSLLRFLVITVDGEPAASPRGKAYDMNAKRREHLVSAALRAIRPDGMVSAKHLRALIACPPLIRVYVPKTRMGPWREMIVQRALEARAGGEFSGAVRVDCLFRIARPKGHYGTGRNATTLRASAPRHHESKPDRDNLDKVVLDALTEAGLFADDCQACCGWIERRWCQPGEAPGARIVIKSLT